jgi:hypothetical protein
MMAMLRVLALERAGFVDCIVKTPSSHGAKLSMRRRPGIAGHSAWFYLATGDPSARKLTGNEMVIVTTS